MFWRQIDLHSLRGALPAWNRLSHENDNNSSSSSSSSSSPTDILYADENKDKLELIKVQVIARHGARTPITSLPGEGLEAYEWTCGPFFSSSNAMVLSDENNIQDRKDGPLFHYRTVSVPNKLRGDCIQGQLTLKGMQQMYSEGKQFQERYVSMDDADTKLLNASDFEGETDKIYVRSTDITSRRTEMSALYFMMGFTPEAMRGRYQLSIDLAERARETMYAHEGSCKRLKQLVKENRTGIMALKETEKNAQYDLYLRRQLGLITQEEYTREYNQLNQKHHPLQQTIPFEGADAGGDVVLADVADEIPTSKNAKTPPGSDEKTGRTFRMEGLHNTLQCIDFDGKPLPSGLTAQDLNLIQEYISEYANIRFHGKEVARLSIGRFIGELLQAQKSTISAHDQFESAGTDAFVMSPSRRVFEAYFAHDTTLIPLTKAFENYYEWPPFASNITLELYKRRNGMGQVPGANLSAKNEYFVKFLYNGQAMKIPECDKRLAASGRSTEFSQDERLYPFDIWFQAANDIVPEDYAKECAFCPSTTETTATAINTKNE